MKKKYRKLIYLNECTPEYFMIQANKKSVCITEHYKCLNFADAKLSFLLVANKVIINACVYHLYQIAVYFYIQRLLRHQS